MRSMFLGPALAISLAIAWIAPASAFIEFPPTGDDLQDCAMVRGEPGITACTRAIDSGKHDGEALVRLFSARCAHYLTKGDADLAIGDCDQAVRLDPKSFAAYLQRGKAYFAKGNIDRAILDYDSAIALEPSSGDAYFGRGDLYRLKGDRERAMTNYNEWLRLAPDRAEALHVRGERYTDFGWYDAALADLSESLRLRPDDAPTLDGRGRNYLFMKDYRRAISDFDEAVRIGRFDNSTYARGWARLQIGETREGNEDIAVAKRSSPDVESYDRYYGIKP